MPAEHRFTLRKRIEFADTDLAGIMHFSNFFRFMEVTEHAFYRSLGFSVHPFRHHLEEMSGGPKVGWPRVHATADFRLPLNFEEEVDVELLVEEVRHRTLSYAFRFWKFPDVAEKRAVAATGRFTVVCVAMDEASGKMKAVAIPDEVREKIEAAPPEVLEEFESHARVS